MGAVRGIELAPERRLASIIVHPARMSMEPDAEGFRQVHIRRRGRRRVPPRSARPVPPNFVGLYFNCLAGDHVKTACTFLSRCLNCRREGHRA